MINRKILIPFISFFATVVISYVFFDIFFLKHRILRGTRINDFNVGGMTEEEATVKLNEKFNEAVKNNVIVLRFNGKGWMITYKELNAHFDVKKEANEAYKKGREAKILTRLLIQSGLKKNKTSINMDLLYDASVIDKRVKGIADELRIKPVDAEIKFEKYRFKISDDISGREVERGKLTSMIKYSLTKRRTEDILEIPVIVINAEKTAQMLKTISVKLSAFHTSFGTVNSNRASNIIIGTKSVDGTVIMPGQIFSLNDVLGPRIQKYGYKEAPIIIDGELVPGMGGGVCQVATTLYNAALLADLDIVERKNHGLKIGYIGLGRDATISQGYIDLKFRNNRKYPIYIRGTVARNSVGFEIYGDSTTPGMRVSIVVDIVEIIRPKPRIIESPALPVGMEKLNKGSKNGYKVKSYRRTYLNGLMIRDELLGEDYYRPVNGEIIRGTGR